MVEASQIREHMKVVGSDGQHIGTVDRIEGRQIKLAKSDPAAGGEHNCIDLGMVDEIKDGSVCLSSTAEEAREAWH
jgi:hypothetical protein